jgi:hypothetical protein
VNQGPIAARLANQIGNEAWELNRSVKLSQQNHHARSQSHLGASDG